MKNVAFHFEVDLNLSVVILGVFFVFVGFFFLEIPEIGKKR